MRTVAGLLAVIVASGMALLAPVRAQQGAKPASNAGAAASDDDQSKPARRLPTFYSKLVDDAQRAKVYAIQAKYQDQIEDLEEQLEAVREKRDAEIEGVLTAEQRATLVKLKAEAAERSAASKQPAAPPPSPAAAPAPAAAAPAAKKTPRPGGN
jgi:Spy/CpxP family protein refolding chaperone